MVSDEWKPALAAIEQSTFYSGEKEKTKLNWFCYEIAMDFYDEILAEAEKELKEQGIGSKELAGFSVYLSKKMKEIILQKLAGEIESLCFSYEMVEEYFPNLDDETVNGFLDAAAKAWDTQLSICEKCPTRCISEKDAYCTMFEKETLRQ